MKPAHKLTPADRRQIIEKARWLFSQCGPETRAALARLTAADATSAPAAVHTRTLPPLRPGKRKPTITQHSLFNPE